ncbi:unnamed protein product [Schistocephalus solidus]|uniref:Protein kinase domain-containing protein n=1 Tax=Schistocephalus solidus TaxID=70667 RepID=A0A183TIY4_SCHSO|nr:unnamed protein product [Schistocephalus solidus]
MTKQEIEREVNILRSINHQNIVQLHGFYEEDENFVLLLELVAGGELFARVAELEKLPEDEATLFVSQILHGVEHLHNLGIVHLDLKNFRVWDAVLPSQLQYSAEPAEMEVIRFPGLTRVYGPGLRSVKEHRQDDGLAHLQFTVQMNTVANPHGGLQEICWATLSLILVLGDSVIPS